jgi:hypothetical protein
MGIGMILFESKTEDVKKGYPAEVKNTNSDPVF